MIIKKSDRRMRTLKIDERLVMCESIIQSYGEKF